MAMPETVLNDWEALSEEDRIKAQLFIHELLNSRKSAKKADGGFPLGIWEGGLFYMADDFNDIPEGFEDYI